MTVSILTALMTKKMTVRLLEAGGIMMPENGMCQMIWIKTNSNDGGHRTPEDLHHKWVMKSLLKTQRLSMNIGLN